MSDIKTFGAAAVLATLGLAPATAATLPVPIDQSVAIEAPSAGLVNDPDFFFFGTTAFGAGTAVGTTPSPTGLDVFVEGFDVYGAVLTAASGGDTYLFADVVDDVTAVSTAADDGTDLIRILFSNVSGLLADDFGSRIVVTYRGEFGADPLTSYFEDLDASLVVNAVIPLPPAIALFGTAFAALGIAARRRRTT